MMGSCGGHVGLPTHTMGAPTSAAMAAEFGRLGVAMALVLLAAVLPVLWERPDAHVLAPAFSESPLAQIDCTLQTPAPARLRPLQPNPGPCQTSEFVRW